MAGIESLPTLPQVLNEVLSALENKDTGVDRIERLVRRDQALSSKLLSVANSPYYGFSAKITTLKRAVVVLGNQEVRKVCLGMGIASLINPCRMADPQEVENLWQHSVTCAEAARIVASRTGGADPEQAFTGGLLHDLGKLVLAGYFPQEMAQVHLLVAREGLSPHQAEAELGVDHEDVGISLAEHWRLPPMLAEVMGRHHEPYPGLEYLPLVATVHVADCLAGELGPTAEGEYLEPYPEALNALAISEQDLWWCRQRLEKRAEAILELRRSLA